MFVSVELTEAAGSLQDLAPGLLRAERDGVRLTVRVWRKFTGQTVGIIGLTSVRESSLRAAGHEGPTLRLRNKTI